MYFLILLDGNSSAHLFFFFIKNRIYSLGVFFFFGFLLAVLFTTFFFSEFTSSSCGSNFVYDGTFSGKKIPGQGVTAKLLKKSGIHIYSENDIPDLIFKLENNKN